MYDHVKALSQREKPTNVSKIPKCTLVQALWLCTGRTVHRASRGIALLFLDHGTRRGEGSASRPGRSLPLGKTRYPLYRRLDGPQGRSGQVWKISPPPGLDPRAVQPVASRSTDYATRPKKTGTAFIMLPHHGLAMCLARKLRIALCAYRLLNVLSRLTFKNCAW